MVVRVVTLLLLVTLLSHIKNVDWERCKPFFKNTKPLQTSLTFPFVPPHLPIHSPLDTLSQSPTPSNVHYLPPPSAIHSPPPSSICSPTPIPIHLPPPSPIHLPPPIPIHLPHPHSTSKQPKPITTNSNAPTIAFNSTFRKSQPAKVSKQASSISTHATTSAKHLATHISANRSHPTTTKSNLQSQKAPLQESC